MVHPPAYFRPTIDTEAAKYDVEQADDLIGDGELQAAILILDKALRADPAYEGGEHFVRLSWRRPPPEEVGRFFVYCYETPGEALPDLRHEERGQQQPPGNWRC